jgi:hypothetical protein
MFNLKKSILPLLFVTTIISNLNADTSSTVPANNGQCPSGANYSGAGYCKANGDWAYVRASNGQCPSGANYAGAGYCKTNGSTDYVQANNGQCPSGYNYAGAGYCKK